MGEWAGEPVGPDVWETCRELIPAGNVFAFLAEHRQALFPAEMFADMYPSANGRPSMPPQILAAAIVLQALHGLSDFDTVQELRCELRWKAACGLGLHDTAFDASLLAYFRRRLAELAPTVLASAEPVDRTLVALRAAGYVPVGASDGSAPLIERAPARPSRRRKRPAGKAEAFRPRTPIDLAARLHGTPPDPPAEADGVEARMTDLAPHLSVAERRMLVHVVQTGTAVGIDYVNGEGNATTRVIEKVRLATPSSPAWCRLRDHARGGQGSLAGHRRRRPVERPELLGPLGQGAQGPVVRHQRRGSCSAPTGPS